MDIYVLDTSLNTVGVVDNYLSFIWTERYYTCGDFEVYLTASREMMELFKKDRYVAIGKSNRLMIIESLAIRADVEDGDKLIVSGRSLESLLDRRVVFSQTDISGNLQDGIHKLLKDSIIEPSIEDRKIDNFVFQESTDSRITPHTLKAQYLGENIYELISELCKMHNMGFKVELDSNMKFVFSLYKGEDRSYGQSANSFVIFSKSFDNLVSTDYSETNEESKNVALIAGEKREDTPRLIVSTGNATGLNRRETFVDASGTSMMKYQGPDEEEVQMDEAEYSAILVQRGKEELSQKGEETDVNAEIEFLGQYVPDRDYFLGDTVQIIDEYNIDSKAVITEMITSYDQSGNSVYPTFEVAGTSRLPAEYQEVEYLQSNGNSYINTEIAPQNGMTAEVEFRFIESPTAEQQIFAYYKGPENRWQCGGLGGGKLYTTGYFGYSQDDPTQWTVGYGSYGQEDDGANMYLFAQDMYNTGAAEYIEGKKQVRSVVVRLNGSLYAELVPCYRVADGVAGFYDIKRQRFLTNLGEEDFTLGPIIGREVIVNYSPDVPEIYQKLEYIENSGNAYIDTKISTRAIGDKINYDFHGYTESYTSNYMFGAQQYTGNWLYGSIYASGVNDRIDVEYNSAAITFPKASDIAMTQAVSGDKFSVTVNGTTQTVDVGTNNEAKTLLIFACWNTDGSVRYFNAPMRVYYLIVRNGDSVVAAYRPVKRKSDGVAGLYELVSGEFYTNAGSGSIVAGPDETLPYPGPYTVVPQFSDQELPTNNLGMTADITVTPIPASVAEIEQDDDTLTIS